MASTRESPGADGEKSPTAFRTISEVAEDLDLPQHVLRFWETRFPQIKPLKRGGSRRYYRPEDVLLLRGIRLLLYGEGFKIRGVQRLLKEKGTGFVMAVGQSGSVATLAIPDEDRAAADGIPEDESFDPDPAMLDAGSDLPPPEAGVALSPEHRERLEAALLDLMEVQRLLQRDS